MEDVGGCSLGGIFLQEETSLGFEDLQALVEHAEAGGDLGISHVGWLVWAGRDSHRNRG